MRMMPTPRMRRHFLLSTTTMLIVVLLVMNTGRNVNGDQETAAAKKPPQQQEQQPEENRPEVQTGTCGLGKHTLNTDGKVTLAKGSRVATKDDNYQESGGGKFKGCKVENKGGFFIVHYDENAAKEGCAVDFIAKQEMASKIEFKASVTDDGSCLAKCASLDAQKLATNENIVPFVFSQNNAKVVKLHGGPEYKGKPKPDGTTTTCKDECTALSAKGECISFTALEIRWAKCGEKIYGYLHQVGEPKIEGTTAVVGVGTGTNEATMDISGTANKEEDGASFTYKGTPLPSPPVCISAIDKGIPVPKAWPIVNGVGDLKDSYLFVFHLLPQKATRKYDGPKISNQKPQGMLPACMEKGLSFKFPTDKYTGLLTTMELPTTPSTTTTTTTAKTPPPMGSSDQTEKTVETTSATSPSGGPTTTTAPCPAVQPEANGSSSPANLPIMEDVRLIATAAVLLVILIVLIIVIICLYRKYKRAKGRPLVIVESGLQTRIDNHMKERQTLMQQADEFGKEDDDDGRSKMGKFKISEEQQPMDNDEDNRRTKKKTEMQSVKDNRRTKKNDDDDYADDDEEDCGGRGSPNKGSGKDNEEEFTMEPAQQDDKTMANNQDEPGTVREEIPPDMQSYV